MLIEGRNAVKEALCSDTTVEKMLVTNGQIDNTLKMIIAMAKKKGVRVVFTEKQILDKTSETGKHQGVICYTTEFKYSDLDEILASKSENRLILLLDEIEDPHNLGSIIRVAECMGVDGIVIPKQRSATVNETVIKTSAGATQYMKIVKVTNINDTIRELKDQFFNVYGLDMDGVSLEDAHLTGDLALVVGNEGKGIKQLTRKLCDGMVSIPMKGNIDSLNASVATGIALYGCFIQREKK